MAGMALSNASSITLQTSVVNVSECVCSCNTKRRLLVLSSSADFTFIHFNVLGKNYKYVDVIVLL